MGVALWCNPTRCAVCPEATVWLLLPLYTLLGWGALAGIMSVAVAGVVWLAACSATACAAALVAALQALHLLGTSVEGLAKC